MPGNPAGLPPAVSAYLSTPKDQTGGILGQLFTADAVVHDEGRTHIGLDAIRSWNSGVSAAFTFTRAIVSAALPRNAAIVRVRLDGNFPGSPVELHHHFSLASGKITALTICP
jgi:SnoaL-like domain